MKRAGRCVFPKGKKYMGEQIPGEFSCLAKGDVSPKVETMKQLTTAPLLPAKSRDN